MSVSLHGGHDVGEGRGGHGCFQKREEDTSWRRSHGDGDGLGREKDDADVRSGKRSSVSKVGKKDLDESGVSEV